MQNRSRVAVLFLALGACAQQGIHGGPSLAELRGLGAGVSLATASTPMRGLSASYVIGSQVRDGGGTSLGRVSDLLVGPTGRIEAVLLSPGGLGGPETSVPWAAIRPAEGRGLSVDPDARGAEAATPSGSWRAASVLDRMVSVQDGKPYGIVSDLVFDGDGALRQVLVTPDGTEGVRYPIDHPFKRADADYVPGLGPTGAYE